MLMSWERHQKQGSPFDMGTGMPSNESALLLQIGFTMGDLYLRQQTWASLRNTELGQLYILEA